MNWTGSAHGNLYGGLTIASGGVLNAGTEWGYALSFHGGVTNAGTIRFLSGLVGASASLGGVIVNQPGGMIDVQIDEWIGGDGPILNAGTFRKSAGSGTTFVFPPFTNTGIVDAQSGIISLFSGGSLEGNFHAAAGAAIRLGRGAFTYSTLPSFTGLGDFWLDGATLTLVNNPIPGLQMISGTVILGPAFQGGTITNLSLGGIMLNSDHPVSGVLNAAGTVASNLTIASGATVNWSAGTMSGCTIASGGTLNWTGSAYGNLYGGLTIASGGVLNAGTEGGYALSFYGGVTNAGTIRLTGVAGGLIVNQPGGIIDVQSDYWIDGNGPILNAGTFRKSAGRGPTIVFAPLTNTTGTVQAHTGTIEFRSFHQAPAATLSISIGGPTPGTDYGHIRFAQPLALDGAFTASARNGYLPNPGDMFSVLSYPSFTADFTCLSGIALGGGIVVFPTMRPKSMTLTAANSAPNAPTIFATPWAGGVRLLRPPGFNDWEFVATTNLFAPVWTPVPATGCDHMTLPVTAPLQYLRLRKNN